MSIVLQRDRAAWTRDKIFTTRAALTQLKSFSLLLFVGLFRVALNTSSIFFSPYVLVVLSELKLRTLDFSSATSDNDSGRGGIGDGIIGNCSFSESDFSIE